MRCHRRFAQDQCRRAVAIVNSRGTITEQFLVDAPGAGLRELVRQLRRAGVGEIAIERGDGQVVDTLLDAGLTVVVITPSQVHNLCGRYSSAENKDDRLDASAVADTRPADRARCALPPARPGAARGPAAGRDRGHSAPTPAPWPDLRIAAARVRHGDPRGPRRPVRDPRRTRALVAAAERAGSTSFVTRSSRTCPGSSGG